MLPSICIRYAVTVFCFLFLITHFSDCLVACARYHVLILALTKKGAEMPCICFSCLESAWSLLSLSLSLSLSLCLSLILSPASQHVFLSVLIHIVAWYMLLLIWGSMGCKRRNGQLSFESCVFVSCPSLSVPGVGLVNRRALLYLVQRGVRISS